MDDLKELVNDIVEYTRTWSISNTEWYWNINCVRKSNIRSNKNITNEEFEVAIREEILYDLVFNNGAGLIEQLENDYQYGYDTENFDRDNKGLEQKVKNYIKDFKVERWY